MDLQITRDYLLNSRIRIFSNHTRDKYFLRFKSAEVWYLISLLLSVSKKNICDFSLTTIFPYKIIFDNLLDTIEYYDEQVFVIFLENFFHSSEYYLNYIKILLDKLKKKWISKKIILHSLKLSEKESQELMEKYDSICVIVRTDIEKFFGDFIWKSLWLNKIDNITYRTNSWEVLSTKEAIIRHSLDWYVYGAYHNWYLDLLQDDILFKSMLATIVDKEYKNDIKSIYMGNLNNKSALLSTWRGCKYKCLYCFRWAKYSNIRQIPLDVVEKDLIYLQSRWYKKIYVYDDCFLTTNYDRLDDVLALFNKYNFSYNVAIRYEMINPDIFDKFVKSKIQRIQIWVQTINENTNKEFGRNFDMKRFVKIFNLLKKQWKEVSIDLILWLPGDSLKDFVSTLNFCLELKPSSIFINHLFLSPWTKLYENKEKYWIKYDLIPKNSLRFLHWSPVVKSSDSFTSKDYQLANKYITKVSKIFKDILIINR